MKSPVEGADRNVGVWKAGTMRKSLEWVFGEEIRQEG